MTQSRITKALTEHRSPGGAFIPFVTGGDPNAETSLEIIKLLADKGANVIEIGVPFSDPMADGPTIQRSSERSLSAGMSLEKVIALIRRFRASSDVPVVLFSYLNPLLSFGLERLSMQCADAGIDGVLVTDAAGREAREIRDCLRLNEIDLISLVAPTTSDSRLLQIAERASGFIYTISRAGVTGAQTSVSDSARALVHRVRKLTDLPVAVGFGISTRTQIEEVWQYADAAVVGSAIVAQIEIAAGRDVAAAVSEFVDALLPQQSLRKAR